MNREAAAKPSGGTMYSRHDRAAFAAFFRQEIAPGLGALERARANRLKTAYVRGLGTAATTAMAVMIVAFLREPVPAVLLLFALLTLGVTITSEILIGALPSGARTGALASRLRHHPLARGLLLGFGIVAGILLLWLALHLGLGRRYILVPHYQMAMVMPFFGAALGFFWVRAALRDYDARLQAFVLPALCRFLGDITYVAEPDEIIDLRYLQNLGILPKYSSAFLSHLLIGRHRDTVFRAVAARLTDTGDDPGLAFEGLLCEVAVPRPFACSILMTFSFSALGKLGELFNEIQDYWRSTTTELWPVDLRHPEFEERYRVYSDDPQAALGLLSRDFLRTLLDISEELEPLPVRCAFLNGRFVIALPMKLDIFDFGGAHRSLRHAEGDLLCVAQAFTIPHRLIDTLHGDREALLPDTGKD